MAEFSADDDIVTQFLLNTCVSRQVFDHRRSVALHFNVGLASNRELPGYSKAGIGSRMAVSSLTTGSAVELYIEPMLSCVGDVDFMIHGSNELAIPSGTAPPTDLPGEFDSRVVVCEIIDSEFPAYVYLVSAYLLTECIDDGKYNAVECQRCHDGVLLTLLTGVRGTVVVDFRTKSVSCDFT